MSETRAKRLRRVYDARLWTNQEAADIHALFVGGMDTATLAAGYFVHESDIVRAIDQHRVAVRGK